jgi:putative DeoR family transcriptional regulator (stage III sporulation protein D)
MRRSSKTNVVNRAIQEAEYIIENNCTIRKAAEHFKMSKSTIWRDLDVYIQKDSLLYQQVRAILDKNFSERSKRGGQATKEKYKLLK